MVEIHSMAYPKGTQTKLNGLNTGTTYVVEAEAAATVHNRFICEKCGHDTGWQPVEVKMKRTHSLKGASDTEGVRTAERGIREEIQGQLASLEVLPPTENRCPDTAYLDIKNAQCPKCKHTQSWYRQKESRTLMGCGFFGMILGVIGVLLSVAFSFNDIGGILVIVGFIGLVLVLVGVGTKLAAKNKANQVRSQGKMPYAQWSFTENAPN